MHSCFFLRIVYISIASVSWRLTGNIHHLTLYVTLYIPRYYINAFKRFGRKYVMTDYFSRRIYRWCSTLKKHIHLLLFVTCSSLDNLFRIHLSYLIISPVSCCLPKVFLIIPKRFKSIYHYIFKESLSLIVTCPESL